jgi:plasmid maintenance system antidote protein VapI
MTSTAELIKEELKQAKATVKELAEFVGVDEERIEDIIKGVKKPNAHERVQMATFFDLDPMLFIGGK